MFVDRNGRPFGCVEEDTDGENRDKLRLKQTNNTLRKQWKAHCARVAVKLGLAVPVMPREGSNHVVRIAMAFQIRQEFGLKEAANYLGDQEDSIIGHYEGVSGKLVDHSILAQQYVPFEPPSMSRERRKRAITEEAKGTVSALTSLPTSHAQERMHASLDRLVEQFAAGEIDQSVFFERSRRLESALYLY